jgi:TP901 family phage tail tape measure protein
MADVIADLLVRIGADIAGMQQGFSDAEASLRNFGEQTTAAGMGLVRLGAPLTAVGVLAANTAGDFEASMNILAVAAGDSGASLEDLRNVAITAGADVHLVGVGAADVALAMTNMTKAGVSTSDMLGNMQGYLDGTAQMGGALRAAIDLAAASELDLDDASRLVVTTMSIFGLSADEVVGAMSNYVQAADASVASVGDLRDAMENVGPTMAAFGFSLGDVNTALALLSTRGITGSEAGTALRAMFTNLMRDTPSVTTTLAELNVSLYNMDGTMRSLPQIIADLSGAMAGMTEEQRNQTVQTLAGTYGMKAMNTLLAEGAPGWNAMTTAIGSAATMQETAAARTQGFNASMTQLRDTVETFLINVGTPLIRDVLTPMAQRFTELVGGLAGVNPQWVELAIVVGGVVTVLGTVLVIAGQIATALAALAPVVAAVGAPFLLIAAAVALFAAAWANDWGGIRETLTAVWNDTLSPLLNTLVLWFQDNIPRALQALADFWNNTLLPALRALQGVWDADVRPALEGMRGWLADNVPAAAGRLADAWNNTLLPALRNLEGTWQSNVRPALEDLARWLADNIPAAAGRVAGGFSEATQAMSAVGNFIGQYLIPLFSSLVNVASAVSDVVRTALAGAWDNVLLPALQAAWGFLQYSILPVFNALGAVLGPPTSGPLAFLAQLWADLQESLSHIPQILTDVTTWFNNLAGTIRALRLPDWLTPGSPTPLEIALLGILEALRRVAGGPWDWFQDILRALGLGGPGGGGTGGRTTNINVNMAAGAVVVYAGDPSGANDIGLAIARAIAALIEAESTVGASAAGQYIPPWAF